jgi:hypothetical protein
MSKQTLIIFYWMLRELQRFGEGLIAPDLVAAAWIIQGTNLGSMSSVSQTEKAIDLRGEDFICIAESRKRSMKGYLDSRDVLQHLQGFGRGVLLSFRWGQST